MNNYLIHWGKKGMRWGHRTPGASISVTKNTKKEQKSEKKKASDDQKAKDYADAKSKIDASTKMVDESKKIDKHFHDKKVKEQTNQIKKLDLSAYDDVELKRVVGRMSLEKQYKTLTAEMTVKGESKAKQILDATGTMLVLANSAVTFAAAMQQFTGKKKE